MNNDVLMRDHTTLLVWFQLWYCWGLCWEVDNGPPLLILLRLEMLTDGARTSWWDEPLNGTNDREEAAINYIWTGWVWGKAGRGSRLHEITDNYREIHRLYVKLIEQNWEMSTCNRLDLESLGSQPIMPKNLPDHWMALLHSLVHGLKINTGVTKRKVSLWGTSSTSPHET